MQTFRIRLIDKCFLLKVINMEQRLLDGLIFIQTTTICFTGLCNFFLSEFYYCSHTKVLYFCIVLIYYRNLTLIEYSLKYICLIATKWLDEIHDPLASWYSTRQRWLLSYGGAVTWKHGLTTATKRSSRRRYTR